jgi:sterol desaturase/sphingolipid hydroxylase (fatty acid hydroxylase superfamily)
MKTIENMAGFFRALSIEEILALVFITAAITEWLTGKIKHIPVHNKRDSISNFLVGLVSFAADFLFSIITFPLWLYLFDHFRLVSFDNNQLWVFLLLFVFIDFTEYWFHRLSHEINFLWSAHQVHHQSTFFNLTVGLRTSLFIPVFNLFFYLLFPVLGFDPLLMVFIIFIQGIYQLLIHTQLVGKLGFIEYILVTPSAHRVHHGKNDIYLDRNYGKCLVVWDRIFGTYQAETETVEFGLTTPMEKTNVWHVLFHPYKILLRLFKQASDRKTKMHILFKGPAWINERYKQDKQNHHAHE